MAGAAAEVGLRGSVPNLAISVGLASVVAALLADRRVEAPSARAAAAAALVPIAFLAVRTSPWLTTANVAATAVLVCLAVACAHDGGVARLGFGSLIGRLARAWPDAASAPRLLAPLVPTPSDRTNDRVRRAALAVLISLPVLAAITLLLASADPVFASLLTPDVAAGPAVVHLAATIVLALAAVVAVGAAATRHAPDEPPPGRVGALEVAMVLGATAAILGLFVSSQLLAATEAGRRLVTDAGLTPADYARSGFFQLCWATGLVLALLAVLRRVAAPGVLVHPAIRALGAAVPVLAVGLAVVAARRMALYDDAFGLTMLRLWVLGATAWMALVLLLVAARNLRGSGRWVGAAALTAALVLVVGADVADPEAFVVRHNAARAERGAPLDVAYLGELSADAVPALLDAAERTDDPTIAEDLRWAAGCPSAGSQGVDRLNLASRRADEARARSC